VLTIYVAVPNQITVMNIVQHCTGKIGTHKCKQ